MQLTVLSSGSEGNSALVRVGTWCALVDAGLGRDEMLARLERAGVGSGTLGHVLVTHGHLDHARSSGLVAKRWRATLHAAESSLAHPWARRAKRMAALAIDRTIDLAHEGHEPRLAVASVTLPHDCDPTVAFALEHAGRRAVIVTDMGKPDPDVARRLRGAHVLVLEFNYEPELMRNGPYPYQLQRRITGGAGHLSNAEGARMLELLASEHLHTLVVAHVSTKTNRYEIAEAAARATLERLGLAHVRVLVATPERALESLEV